jgi:uncharacterized membrane protein YccC
MNWSQFEGLAAIRCTAGVAIVLAAGLLLGQPAVSAFGAVGAVSVGFGSFQGAYRSRAAVMLWAAAGMALSIFVGSIAGGSHAASIVTATLAAFLGGLMVALGPSASFVGLQCVVAVLIATGFPADAHGALVRGAIVFGGGLVQTLLVVMIWPLRRFTAERQTIAAVYRSLAAYAAQLPSAGATAPEPHTLAGTASPTYDPQPFARAAEVLVFQALLDEAERIRASLAALATQQHRLAAASPACARSLAGQCGRALAEIADALEGGREPREATPIWEPIEACARDVASSPVVDSLLGQMRAAWRIAGVMSGEEGDRSARHAPLRRRPPIRDALTTLGANLTLRSTALRHALRLAVTIGIGTAIYRYVHLDRGYWLPMTSLLVLRPEFHDTLTRGLARIGGTLVGAAIATAIVHFAAPTAGILTLMVLVFVWGCYALFRINYALFTVCLTGYVVFILMLSGVAEMTAASLRALYTIEGGAFALIVYAVWPTWASQTARASLAAMLDAHAGYVEALLAAYADPARTDLRRLAQLRSAARLLRSNAEAVIERMLAEPPSRAALPPRTALGLLAALRRHALAALALHAGLERGLSAPVGGMASLEDQMTGSLKALAGAVRAGTPPPPLPPLRQTHLALAPAADTLVLDETDLMVDSINTMADLLSGASVA